MPAPKLTWQFSAVTPLSSPSVQELLDEYEALIDVSSHWEIKSKAAGRLEVGPVTGGNVDDLRILIQSNASTRWLAPVSASGLFIGIAPEGGTGALGTADSADPYGGGRRFSTYTRFIDSAPDFDNCWLIESEEVLVFCAEDTAASARQQGALAGAWLLGSSASGGEDDDNRIYGIASSGGFDISTTFWTRTDTFMAHNGQSGTAHCGCFDPGNPSSWVAITRLNEFTIQDDYLEDETGAEIGLPFHYRHDGAPWKYIGEARQLCVTGERTSRSILRSGGEDKRLVWGSDRATTNDALGFCN